MFTSDEGLRPTALIEGQILRVALDNHLQGRANTRQS
jgi:hypothetical protein